MNYPRAFIRSILALFISIVLIITPTIHASATIPLAALEGYDLAVMPIKQVTEYKRAVYQGQVRHPAQEILQLHFPYEIQQINLLKNHGDTVTKHERIASLIGHDLERFLEQGRQYKNLYELAEKTIQKYKPMYSQGKINAATWQQFNKDYVAARMDHYEHQQLIEHLDITEDGIYLTAPKDGVLIITHTQPDLPDIAIASAEFTWLKIELPAGAIKKGDFLESKNCRFEVTLVKPHTNGYEMTAYAKAKPSETCNFQYNQPLLISHITGVEAFQLSRQALALIDGKESIFVVRSNELSAVEVKVLSSNSGLVIFTSELLRNDDMVVTQSVGAIKGILLELGAE